LSSNLGQILRIDLATGKTIKVLPVSTQFDTARSPIAGYAAMEIENGMRIITNHKGSIAITDFMNGEDAPRIRAVLYFNQQGLSEPTDQNDQDNLAVSTDFDETNKFLTIRTQNRTDIRMDVEKFVETYGNQTGPIYLSDVVDNAMAAFPASDLATNKFTKGGIDLNSANLELTIKGETIHFTIPKELENITPAQVQGITPTIINFSPWVPLQSGFKP
jgi:hypothetical protein